MTWPWAWAGQAVPSADARIVRMWRVCGIVGFWALGLGWPGAALCRWCGLRKSARFAESLASWPWAWVGHGLGLARGRLVLTWGLCGCGGCVDFRPWSDVRHLMFGESFGMRYGLPCFVRWNKQHNGDGVITRSTVR